ncbi:MAG: DegT/DnrJ/EryC1/StrS family aminotransferase [Synergistales bacterium]|nr:DegT/DnrJ/EryC1/StrS family aminotransferase [Synergistales bacterium]
MKVPLSRPDISSEDKQAVLSVLETPFLALGPNLPKFEDAVARYVGTRFGVAVNSGTSALHLLVRAFGIGEGDEVITTPFSFIASSNCILYERARPVFVDVEAETGNIAPGLIESAITPRTRAILPVDAFGQPARLDVIRAIAERHGLVVIEDACESLGSEYKGKKCGSPAYAHAAAFAFYPNKQITTGEGGMIVTDDPEVARLCRSMRNQGRGEAGVWLSHERLGYNYRMDELSAALGVAQMRRIEEILAKRERVAAMYAERLSRVRGIRIPHVAPEVTRMSWFVYVIRVEEGVDRDAVMDYLIKNGVQCRPYFTPIHLQPFYRALFGYKEGDFPVTERLGRSSIAIPFHNNLTREEIEYVAQKLEEAVTRQ